jgi:hypothetical protein
VVRTDKHYDKNGRENGSTERKERVYGKNITYDKFYRCSLCGYSYNQISIEWKDA